MIIECDSKQIRRRRECVVENKVVMDQTRMEQNNENLEGFNVLFGLTQGIGAILVIMVAVWTSSYRGGFAWRSDPSHEFNWHPLLMTIGMIYLFANSIMIYRSLRNFRKRQLKIFHAAIHGMTLLFITIGLTAAYDSHNFAKPPIPNLYTLHSWVGAIAVTLFTVQWLCGFFAFMFPTIALPLRAAYLPIHIYFGLMAFICAVAASLMGLLEKAIWTLNTKYAERPAEATLINFIGIFLIVFAGLVFYLVTESKYKRYPRPEDGVLLTGASE